MVNLHILGFPFSETTPSWTHCAFTQRTTDFATMMTRAGLPTYLYAGENNSAEVTEHIPIITPTERAEWWPDYLPTRDVFNDFDVNHIGWRTFNARAAAEIHRRASPGDILCLTMGLAHRPVAEALPDLFHVETGIGYSGVWAPYRIFESHAWRHHLAARQPPGETDQFRAYDTVLPRAYDPDDFPEGSGSGDYYLFLGRLTERKGPHIAAMACERIGAKLLVAGQGENGVWWKGKSLRVAGMLELPGNVTYLGTVNAAERAELMGNAIAVFCPSLYLEPFCGVSVEAQLCGTPVVASNWGGLIENITHGTTGFLCDTLADYADGALAAASLDRSTIRKLAHECWTFEALGPKYVRYFTRLQELQGKGWYA